MSGYAEGLLRPADELLSAAMFSMAAIVVAAAPQVFMLAPVFAHPLGFCLGLCALIRLKQGLSVLGYRKRLLRMPYWAMNSDDMPVYQNKLFLGKGFLVLSRHAQRLYDTRQIWAERYVTPSKLYRFARTMEAKYEGKWIERFWSGKRVIARAGKGWGIINTFLGAINPVKPLPPVGGDSRMHGIGLDEEVDCLLPSSARAGHTLVLGTTGVGKTRLAELLVTQDIRRGDVVLMFDPKGDADMLLRMYIECLRAGRLDEFYILHLGYSDQSGRYSPVGRFGRITEVATRVSGQLDGGGNSAAFKQFAWRFVNIIARALDALGKKPDMAAIQRYVTAIDELYVDYCVKKLPSYHPKAAELVTALESNVNEKNTPRHLQGRSARVVALEMYFGAHPAADDVLAGLRSAIQYDKTYFDKIVASLLPLLEKLGTGKTAEIISPVHTPADERPIIDWREVIMQGGVVYVGLDALSDTTVAAAFGNSMFADLCSLAGEIYKFGNAPGFAKIKPRNIMIHADEFNELIGDEFIPILNKARGAKFVVTAYTQTESDIEARLGSPAKAAQTKGNFNSLICLRVREQKTAQILTSRMATVTIKDIVPDTGASDAPGSQTGFHSSNKDTLQNKEVLLVSDNDITNLPIGQAYAELEGAKIWKLRFPLPGNEGDLELPEDIQALVDGMLQKSQSVKSTHDWLHDTEQFNSWMNNAYLGLDEDESKSPIHDVQ
ncbi:type IV conjugative transfer system coupling protein TraD [Vibrio echinoideorum]|uniref:type IV conjugative transfer system coupling protein TraD n=1 Tax=Vibrio echinoideorum TaxID=2100116 RepID=UPI003552F883